MNISESVKEALTHIEKRGLQGDVYGVRKRTITYTIQKGELSDSSEFEDLGLGIRVVKEGRIGFGYCVPGAEEKGVSRAVELSRVSQLADIPLPTAEMVPPVKVCDQKIADEADGKGAELIQMLIDGAHSVKDDIVLPFGILSIITGTRVIGNTSGVFLEEESTALFSGVAAVIFGERTSLYAEKIKCSRQFDIDFYQLGAEAAHKVDSMREKSAVVPGLPVIMCPDALAQLLGFAVIPSFLGENVRKGKSLYQEKVGHPVASERLTITDDPTREWGLGSGKFDDEGCSSGETALIADGILKNFLYDLKEGVKSGTESTGNGVRADFKTPPETESRNIVVRGQGYKRDSFFEGDAIFVDGVMGAHTANPVSGDFSVVANPAWLIHRGEKKGRLDGVMISGNFPELLQEIELADDYTKTFFDLNKFKADIPTARLKNVVVSG